MAQAVADLKVLVKVAGQQGLQKLSRELENVGKNVSKSNFNFDRFTKVLRAKEKQQTRNINNTRAFASTWRELANTMRIGSREFNIATRNAERLERQLNRTGRSAKRFSMGGLARGLGAVAGSAVFGGPEGAIGATLGLIGGPQAALVGGAIGAQVGMLRKSLGEVAKYNAALGLQRKALQLVVGDTQKYNEAQDFLTQTSKELAIPQDVIVRQFTQLTASVTGAGLSVDDAKKAFTAIASGIRGTGGSLEDMRSAMVATSQVFSKGKVSAEELRQQLGERLPGAFTIFAESMGKTPAELDKALEQGAVTLSDFMGFADTLFERYGENAKILAQAPEAAGDRLQTVMAELKDTYGGLFTNIGAGLQSTMARLGQALIDNEKSIKKWATNLINWGVKVWESTKIIVKGLWDFGGAVFEFYANQADALIKLVNKVLRAILIPIEKAWSLIKKINEVMKPVQELILHGQTIDLGGDLKAIMEFLYHRTHLAPGMKAAFEGGFSLDKLKEIIGGKGAFTEDELFEETSLGIEVLTNKVKKLGEATTDLAQKSRTAYSSMLDGIKEYQESIKDFHQQIQDATVGVFKKMEDSLYDFVTTGKLAIGDFARYVIAELTRIAIRRTMFSFLGMFGFEKGGSFANGIVPFSRGGVVNKPTMFAYGGAGNFGIMGEGGAPEAILPLKRGSSGRLGVESHGAGETTINIQVDASGSNVEGRGEQAEQLGKAISAAVQNELVIQRRPGGLLN